MTISQKQTEKYKIISAFRKYTRLGLANNRLSPFEVCDRIRGVSKSREEALDIFAVYDTIRLLKISGKEDVLRAVSAVYMCGMRDKMRKSEISLRILRYAYENNCDERTVYRQLQYARSIYKLVREDISFSVKK